MSELSKHEVLVIALTAVAIASNQPVNSSRLAQYCNALTGKNDTANAVDCRMREFRKRAKDLIAVVESGEGAVLPPVTPKARGGKKGEKTPGSSGVKTGRVAKKTPAKGAKTNVVKEEPEEDEDNLLLEEGELEE